MKRFIEQSTFEQRLDALGEIKWQITNIEKRIENLENSELGIFESVSGREHTLDISRAMLSRLQSRYYRLYKNLCITPNIYVPKGLIDKIKYDESITYKMQIPLERFYMIIIDYLKAVGYDVKVNSYRCGVGVVPSRTWFFQNGSKIFLSDFIGAIITEYKVGFIKTIDVVDEKGNVKLQPKSTRPQRVDVFMLK